MSTPNWEIGMEVIVESRTWPGINKPGGHGKVVKIHYSSQGFVDTLDVRYTLANKIDSNLDTDLVKPHIELNRGRRSRRGRDFFADEYHAKEAANKPKAKSKDEGEETGKENNNPVQETRSKLTKATKKNPPNPGKKPTKKKKKTNNNAIASHPRDSTPPEQFPKKKRNKSGEFSGSSSVAQAVSKKHTTADSFPNKRESVPKFVVTNPSASFQVLSPLVVGRACKVEQPVQLPPVSNVASHNGNEATASAQRECEIRDKFGEKTLKTVFENQMKEAAGYIDSLVGAPNAKSAAGALDGVKSSTQPPTKELGQISPGILDLKTRIWKELSQRDGVLPMDEIGTEFGGREEVVAAVRSLTEDGRVMESDGVLYQTD